MSGYDSAILSTAILEHPDLVRLPRGVRLLYVEALVWSKLHRTDGLILKHMLRRVSDEPDTDAAAAALVASGRWTDEGEAWQIVGYLDHQASAERVAREQAGARARYERYRFGASANAVANAVTNAVTNDTDLTRPDPKGKGAGVRGAAPARPAAGGRVPEEETTDDDFRCARCRNRFPWEQLGDFAKRPGSEEMAICEECARAVSARDRAARNGTASICMAWKKDGSVCTQQVRSDPEWPDPLFCALFHSAPSKRGAKP